MRQDLEQRVTDSAFNHLGEDATYTPTAGQPVELKVTRQTEIDYVPSGYESVVAEERTDLKVRVADVADPQKDDQVEVGGDTFKVVRKEPDGYTQWRLIVKEI